MNIFLIGFRGTGKTSVGKKLAQHLDRKFIDADEYLELKTGKTIKEIFAEGGEKLFRDIETQVIEELCKLDDIVVATGGGAILREENVRMIKKCGVVILLEADADTLFKRICEDNLTEKRRPSLTNNSRYQEILLLLEERKPFYDKTADYVFDTTHFSVNEVVKKILSFSIK